MPTFLKFDDLNSAYERMTAYIRCECTFATELVGGQPADEEGIRQFVVHHLKITDEIEREKAVQRILHEEIEDATAEGDEVEEGKVYGLRAIRRDNFGPYLGDWMIKANLKNTASRLQIFQQIKGTKGNWAEAGRVRAWKYSLQDPEHPNQIYLRNSGDGPAHTEHKTFRGRVQTPQGPVSIMHESEVCEPGSRFAFEFRFLNNGAKGLTEDDIKDVLALCMIVGLGSARSMERGKFRIESAEIELVPEVTRDVVKKGRELQKKAAAAVEKELAKSKAAAK